MVFEHSAETTGFLRTALAGFEGSKLSEEGVLLLPETFGKGYIKSFDFGESMNMMIHQYTLKEEVTIKRTGNHTKKEVVTFSFRNVFQQYNPGPANLSRRNVKWLPSVLLSSGDLDLEIFTPADTQIHTIIINIHINHLKDLLQKKEGDPLLANVISGNRPCLYDEILSPEIQEVATQIIKTNAPKPLNSFYLKLKAEELIYLFFVELLKRQHITTSPLHVSDVKKMYLIKDQLTTNLSIPPTLSELVSLTHMSESKMNRLFKQIFGSSIYQYYQTLRMHEAAYLIKQERLSISEAGYRLGFTNLSHFTRLFEKHMGLKPKKYSAGF